MILCVSSLFCCGISSHRLSETQPKGISIEFQDFFQVDTISVFIEDILILENKIINSEEDIGLTNLLIEIKKLEIGEYTITCPLEKKIKVKLPHLNDEKRLKLRITMNEVKHFFDIDIKEGYYIGFDKNGSDIVLNQSKIPFEYD